MNEQDEQLIRERAGRRCEYCRFPESLAEADFVLDHIIARQHLGKTSSENLALCCGCCNLHKGPNVAGIDPDSGVLTPLFHPRRDLWSEHFRWRGEMIIGITAIGRVTVYVLALNHPAQIAMRRELMNEGTFF